MATPTGQATNKKSLLHVLFWGTVLVYGAKQVNKKGGK